MTDDARSSIVALGGVQILTGHLGEMVRFYRDVVGLRPRSERDHYTNFEWGEVRLSIAAHPGVRGRNADPDRLMIHFLVDDIQAVYGRLRAGGVEFSRKPEQEKWGGWVATFHDPDGNTLQLIQQPVADAR